MHKKNFIITFTIIFLIAVSGAYFLSKNSEPADNSNVNSAAKIVGKDSSLDRIEVMHFHATQQCFSCITVGKFTLKTIQEKFPEEYEQGEIVYKDINIDLRENKEVASEYGATGSALYINNIVDGRNSIEEDTAVWRLVANEEKYITYFEDKLKTKLGK